MSQRVVDHVALFDSQYGGTIPPLQTIVLNQLGALQFIYVFLLYAARSTRAMSRYMEW